MTQTSVAGAREYSLRWRLLRRLGVPIAVVLVISALGTFALARYIGTVVYDHWLYDSAMAIGDQVVTRENRAQLNLPNAAVEMFEWDDRDRIFGNVVTGHGRTLFSNAAFPAAPEDLRVGKPRYYNADIAGLKTRVVAVRIAYPGNRQNSVVIQVAETKKKRDDLIAKIILIGVPFQLFILVLVGLTIWVAVASSLGALNRISAQIAGYHPDGLQPIEDAERVPAEVKPLLTSLNGLIGRLSSAQETQRRFISNAAHQLRTPLATLQVQAERALRETDPARHREALSQVMEALGRSSHMVRQLLTLARSEPSDGPKAASRIDLAEGVRTEMERWIDAATERDIDLGYEGADTGVFVDGEPHLLGELVGNLVDNAIRYTPPGGQVTVRLSSAPLVLQIDDNGPGIPAAQRAAMFERFQRGNSEEAGCGLGLAIVKEIAERHGARAVILDNPAGPGTRVEIVF